MVREYSVWIDLLSDDERHLLQPGVPHGLDRRPDVLVVGGGIIGLAVAAACEAAGLGSVTVIERGRLGGGATGGSMGQLVPETHIGVEPDWLVELMRKSLGLWFELEQRVPGGLGLIDMDWIGLEPLPAGMASALPSSAQPLSATDLHERVPALQPGFTAVRIPHQARLNPLRAVARLAAGLRNVATGVEATAVRMEGDRLAAVQTSTGEIHPGAVVFATGGPPRLDGLGLDLSQVAGWVKGHLVATAPTEARLPGAISPFATQIEDGRLIMGGTLDGHDPSPDVQPDVVEGIWQGFLDRLRPQLRQHTTLSHQWCCFRPWLRDGLPVVDRLPGASNAWLTAGQYRTGVLMAPITGQMLAGWMASGEKPAETRGLEAERLLKLNLSPRLG
jgi:glycine oxidase